MINLFLKVFLVLLGLSMFGVCIAVPLVIPETHWIIKLICACGAICLVVLSFLTVRPLFQNFLSTK